MKKKKDIDTAPNMPHFDKIAETWRVQFYPELERDEHGEYHGKEYDAAQNTTPHSLLIVADTISAGISTAQWYTFTKEWPGGVDHTAGRIKVMRGGKCYRISGDGDEFTIEGFWRVPRAAGDSHLHTINTTEAGLLTRLSYGLIQYGDAIIDDGYTFTFCWNLDRCITSEINDMLRASDTALHYIIAVSTTGDQRGLSFSEVIAIRKKPEASAPTATPPRSLGRPALEPQAPVYLTTKDVADKLREHKETTRKRIQHDPNFPPPDIHGGNGQPHKWRVATIAAYASRCEKNTANKRQYRQ